MLTPRVIRTFGGFGLAIALFCGYPLVTDMLSSVPSSQVASCRVEHVHRATLYVTLDSGRTIELAQENVPNPSQCLAPGTMVEKVRGEFGYRLNGKQYFWESKGNRYFVMFTVAGLAAAAGALAIVLRERRAGERK